MKKILAIALALAMLLTMGLACAEGAEKTRIPYDTALSFDVACPAGYTMTTDRLDAYLLLDFIPEDESQPELVLLLCPDEEYGDLARLNDLSEEDLAAYAASLCEGYNAPTWEVVETASGTKLILINEAESEMDYAEMITVYKGYAIDLYAGAAENAEITEADTAMMQQFLSELDFIDAIGE